MKPELQRIAIAKACGHLNPRYTESGTCIASTNVGSKGYWGSHGVPDYLNDLNAMHEAEKTMTDLGLYRRFLYLVILDDTGNVANEPAWATAAQRAEAFLKTLSLWTDE